MVVADDDEISVSMSVCGNETKYLFMKMTAAIFSQRTTERVAHTFDDNVDNFRNVCDGNNSGYFFQTYFASSLRST